MAGAFVCFGLKIMFSKYREIEKNGKISNLTVVIMVTPTKVR